ncbi:DegT/DnrJ/EryC1/StrS family aminotransferase [Salibacterium lacus]|uniref:DegT/DnrJ/EryC1/StrS family aminotransferase n=1 Tax=Salibacterium lacus TaxID=1898109 RepID=A0ABW5T3A5_9BACI
MIPLMNVRRQFEAVEEEWIRQMKEVLESGIYIMGPKGRELEDKIAGRLGVSDAVAVANGTDALILTLRACGIGEGDEVITTPFTFFATAEAVSSVGAVPVFADIDPATCTIDPLKIEEKITAATKAVLPVHLFGMPADMEDIRALADTYGLLVIEDACQAFGAAYKGQPAGSLGDAACFSFFPTKNLGTPGDGGMVTTSDAALAARIRTLRVHGSDQKYYHREIGYNSRLDELHAAFLLTNLSYIDQWNEERIRLADRYKKALRHLPDVEIPPVSKEKRAVYHLFCIQTGRRREWMDALNSCQIHSGVYYPCCLHLQKAYQHLGYKKGDLPEAEGVSECILAIPLFPGMTDDEQDEVTAVLTGPGRGMA